MALRVIHITPELPPTTGGVADYTSILSRRLVELSDERIEPILVRAGWKAGPEPQVQYRTLDLSGKCNADRLSSMLIGETSSLSGNAVLLLEYSGYGYSKRGVPFWLPRGLQQVIGHGVPLVTMFHELFATGPVWSSSFWLSPLQRQLAAWLARLSSGIVTNRASAASWLRDHRGSERVPVRVQPVFSNIGEPERVEPYAERLPQAVIFGGGRRKRNIYSAGNNFLEDLLDGPVDRVLDIGPSEEPGRNCHADITKCGVLRASEISTQLSVSQLGLLSYPESRLSKSGAAAAFASHGVPFLLFSEGDAPAAADYYLEGEHYWRADRVDPQREGDSWQSTLGEMSRALRELYAGRLHSRHAGQCVVSLIKDAERPTTPKRRSR